MEPLEYAQQLDELIIEAESRLFNGIRTHQRRILRAITSELSKLSYDRRGNIRRSAANIRRIRAIQRELDKVISSPKFESETQRFIRAFSAIEAVSLNYFKGVFSDFSQSPQLDLLQRAAIDEVASGFQAGVNRHLQEPIRRILTQAGTTGGTRQQLEELFTQSLLTQTTAGNRSEVIRLSEFERYVNRYVRDGLSHYSRTLNEAAALDNGAEWFLFAGTVLKTSRKFCLERKNKYFHIEEIRLWAKENWQGKHPQTNEATIFKYLGGYNCTAQLISVLIDSVPANVVKRVRDKGFIE